MIQFALTENIYTEEFSLKMLFPKSYFSLKQLVSLFLGWGRWVKVANLPFDNKLAYIPVLRKPKE